MEHRWLESSDGLLQWGWLCPRQPVDARGDKCLHCLDWQLLHQESGEQPAGVILIWADPQFVPSGLDPQVWVVDLNQLALLASCCGDLAEVALEGDPVLLDALHLLWPLLQSAPSLDQQAAWLVRSTGEAWGLLRS